MGIGLDAKTRTAYQYSEYSQAITTSKLAPIVRTCPKLYQLYRSHPIRARLAIDVHFPQARARVDHPSYSALARNRPHYRIFQSPDTSLIPLASLLSRKQLRRRFGQHQATWLQAHLGVPVAPSHKIEARADANMSSTGSPSRKYVAATSFDFSADAFAADTLSPSGI